MVQDAQTVKIAVVFFVTLMRKIRLTFSEELSLKVRPVHPWSSPVFLKGSVRSKLFL
jgi:hypothetical protein